MKVNSNPLFLLIGLLMVLAGVFLFSLPGGSLLAGLILLLAGSLLIYLSQRTPAHKID